MQTDVDQPVGSRRGRSPRYTVDKDRIEALVTEFREELLGREGEKAVDRYSNEASPPPIVMPTARRAVSVPMRTPS